MIRFEVRRQLKYRMKQSAAQNRYEQEDWRSNECKLTSTLTFYLLTSKWMTRTCRILLVLFTCKVWCLNSAHQNPPKRHFEIKKPNIFVLGAYVTSYSSSIVTLVLSCPVSEILQVFCWEDKLIHPNFRGVPLGLDCRCCGSEERRL